DAQEIEPPISSVPPSTAALTAALNSEPPPEMDSGPRGAVIPPGPDVPKLDSMSDFPDEEGPSITDEVYRAGSATPQVYARLANPELPVERTSSSVTRPTLDPESASPTLSSVGDMDLAITDASDDLDSRPPTIPSAAAVAGPAGVPTALGQVGSE